MKARRRRRLALAAMLTLGAAGAVGCSLGFHPNDYEGPDDTDGADAAPAHDAGQAFDATNPDGTAPTDATMNQDVNASDDAQADGPVLRFCQQQTDAAFCSDFDEAGSIDQDWFGNDTWTRGGGALAVDDMVFAPAPPGSPSGSDRTTIIGLRQDADPQAGAYLVKMLATTPREVVLDFDFNVAQLDGSGLTFVSLYFVGHESRGMYLALDYGSTSTIGMVAVSNLLDSSKWTFSNFAYPVDAAPPWHHITLDMMVVPGGMGTLTAYVDHANARSLSDLYFDSDTEADTLQLTVGLQRPGDNVTPMMDVRFDNVVVSYPDP